ncbi:hypothetical protein ACIOFY_36850 [Streptomyces anulatus]
MTDVTTLHPELAQIRRAQALIDNAELLCLARSRHFGPRSKEGEPGLKAWIDGEGLPGFIASHLRDKARRHERPWLATFESWGDSEWMRMHLARGFVGFQGGIYTRDDVDGVLAAGQRHAQAIVDAFSPPSS